MEETDAAVLDCCEEAFLFDLAAEEVWFDVLHELVHDHAAVTATTAPAAAAEGDAARTGGTPRRSAHRRTPDVRWSTLQLLLRHACLPCRGIRSAHDMDQYIVSALLVTTPQTAAAVVQARARYVGQRLSTRDLVRLVARAAPLRADALTAVRNAFAALLQLEKKAAGVVREELQARRAVAADEDGDRRRLAAAVAQAREAARQAAVLEQRAASQRLLQAALQPALEAARTGVDSAHASVPSPPSPTSPQMLSDNTIAAALHDARCEADAVHEALRAASEAICGSATLYHPLMRDVAQKADQRERRLAALEESAGHLQAMVRRLRCVRCGRRLRQLLRGRGAETQQGGHVRSGVRRPASPVLTTPTRSLRDTLDALRACVGTAASRVTTEQLQELLFDSLVHLNAEVAAGGDALPCAGTDQLHEQLAQRPRSPSPHRPPALRAVMFPVFEYFCEHGEWFTDAVELPARWRVFASYAVPTATHADGSQTRVGEDDSEGPSSWVWQHGLTRTGFSAFLSDLASCDAAGAAAGVRGAVLRDFLATLVVPRWVSAPLLCEAALGAQADATKSGGDLYVQ